MRLTSCHFVLALLSVCPAEGWAQTPTQIPPPSGSILVQPISLAVPAAKSLAARKGSYTITVPGTGAWTDTGIEVTPADHIEFTATGQVTLADGHVSGPEGVARGWKDLLRSSALESANPGALIARIGSSDAAQPFALGATVSRDIPASGELFLAANTGQQADATGSYKAAFKLTSATVTATPATPSINLQIAITPELLADLPRRVADQQGDPGDVVNFSILGTEAQVRKAYTAAGWVQVDTSNNAAVLHGLLSTLSKQSYTELPMSTLYLFGRPQDLSYARAEPLAVALVRHHLRVWNSGQVVNGRMLWVGSATHDDGLERDQRNNGVTHHIDPNIDVERDFIEASFAAAGALDSAAYATPPNAVHAEKTATGGAFSTDGRLLIMVLR